MSSAQAWFPRVLLFAALCLGGCDCGGDPGLGDGGGNGDGSVDPDGGGDGGDGGGTDGGDDGDGGTDGGGDGDGGADGGSDGGACTPLTVEEACPGNCGFISDGCSSGFDCSEAGNGGVTCSPSEQCTEIAPGDNDCVPIAGDGGTCTPFTCEQLGHTCGMAGDGCGNPITCGAPCPMGSTCLSAGPGQPQTCVAGSVICNGPLCDDVPTSCGVPTPTRLTGTVVTPGIAPGGGPFINRVPVPNAVVYIPADPAAIPAIFEGVDPADELSCGRCEDEVFVTGNNSVLASARTGTDGSFELSGRIPIGTAFNIVIKVGKWRRVVQIPAIANCGSTTALTVEQTRLAAHSTDGQPGTQLPKIAISTGWVDEMECVFRNIGIAESEFTVPSGNGRIHMYRGNGARMIGNCSGTFNDNGTTRQCSATVNGYSQFGCTFGRSGCTRTNGSVDEAPLFQTNGRANDYDMVVFDCQGGEGHHNSLTPTENERIETFANAGGRLFASHWEYRWITDNDTMAMSADWNGDTESDSDDAYISLRAGQGGERARAQANEFKSIQFRDWMINLGQLATATPPTFTILEARDLAGENVGSFTDEWVYRTRTSQQIPRVQQLSFNTPYAANPDNICGRVAYSGFHVAGADNDDNDDYFPGVCGNDELSAQEYVLVWALFDLNSCVSTGDPVDPPDCTPLTVEDVCEEENDACGYLSDGCGGLINCGGCGAGHFCQGTMCIPYSCVPDTCASEGYACGTHPDGCGGIALNGMGNTSGCGMCPDGQVCGAGGQCVANCTPNPAPCAGRFCGSASNGCGQTVSCGMCPPSYTCTGDGQCIFIE